MISLRKTANSKSKYKHYDGIFSVQFVTAAENNIQS